MQRTRRPIVANFLLFSVALALALVAAEAAVRVGFAADYDVHPRGLYSADPAVGYVPTPGFTGVFERPEFRHTVTIAPSGLRGTDPAPRTDSTFRILSLGDSFTWGVGVGDAETYPRRLQERLARRFPDVAIDVLNAGVPGYGTADELRLLEMRIDRFDPDLVTVQFLAENDFNDNRRPARDRVEVRDGWLHAAEPPRPGLGGALERVKQTSVFARLLSERAGYLAARLGLRAATDGDRFTNEDTALAAELLGKIAAIARRHDAPTLVIFTTGQTPVIADREVAVAAAPAIAAAAVAADARFVDLSAPMRRREDRLELYYPLDGHWTATGHAAAAEILDAVIAAEFGTLIAAHSNSTWSHTARTR